MADPCCGNCKHWDADDGGSIRVCVRMICKDTPAFVPPPYVLLVGPGCSDASGLLFTPADFGCKLHEVNDRCQTCNGRRMVADDDVGFGPCTTCQPQKQRNETP